MDYSRLDAMAKTRKRKLANNTYLEIREGHYAIRLHKTDILQFWPDGSIVLQSGGWRTVTTKARMNDFIAARISQEKGLWTVSWDGKSYSYADGMRLHDDGTVTGAGTDPHAELKLRKAVRKYAKDYAAAMIAGNVPAPSNGDCWGCLMVDKDGKTVMGVDHLRSHLEEAYFVPSILANELRDPMCNTSIATRDFVGATWSGQRDKVANGFYMEHAQRNIAKLVFRHFAHRLGMTP